MQSESRIDPKIIEEVLKFSKNIIDAPKLVSAPDEIDLEVTPHKVVQQIDKTRLLHYAPLTAYTPTLSLNSAQDRASLWMWVSIIWRMHQAVCWERFCRG